MPYDQKQVGHPAAIKCQKRDIGVFRRWRVAGILLGAMLLGGMAMPVEGETVYLNTRSFHVTIVPADEESRDIRAADLYMTRFRESGWDYYGPCEILGAGETLRFRCPVTVDGDGSFYFASRGVDGAGEAPAPTPDTVPQAHVVVDTTPPMLALTNPVPGTVLRVGEEIRIQWRARDENFGATPVVLFVQTGDAEWTPLGDPQPEMGYHIWEVPDTRGEPIRFMAQATDLAGNLAEDILPGSFRVRHPSDAGVVPTPETVTAIRETLPAPQTGNALPDVPVQALRPDTDPETRTERPRSTVRMYIEAHEADALDPRPVTRHPEFDVNDDALPERYGGESKARAAYVAYIMAGNLVRQERLKDALRYYRTSVDADPNFDKAWNDMAMVYKQLGAFMKADAAIVRALTIEPRDAQYVHNRGEIYQRAGLAKLQDPASSDEDLAYANELIHFAIRMYGRALEFAQQEGRLAERAGTYFRLGEICYFANQDMAGARQYWNKVLELHTPTPDLDNVMLDRGTPDEHRTRQIYRKNTELRLNLETWQNWARAYLRQLNDLERGIYPGAPSGGADPHASHSLSAYPVQTTRAHATPRAHPLPDAHPALHAPAGASGHPGGAFGAHPDGAGVPSYAQRGFGSQSGVRYSTSPVYQPPQEVRPLHPRQDSRGSSRPSIWERLTRKDAK